MNSLVKRKQQWELQNHQLLQKLLEQSSDALMLVVIRAVQLLSFLLFLSLVIGKYGVVLIWSLFKGPRLVRFISPNCYQERHEFEWSKSHQLPSRLF